MNTINRQPIFEPIAGDTFRFSCHKGIPCFTECCAKLHLILTPYDILRIKNRLKLPSDAFLERYTDTDTFNHSMFPMVRLKMKEDKNQTCPFVTEEGCTIYEDRPGACRLYPLGRASTIVDSEKNAREKFFIVHEPHCLGFQQEKSWKMEDWLNHEGVTQYSAMNDQWLEIVTSSKGIGYRNDTTRKSQIFFLASYNLDKFRKFIFESRFFDLFEVASDLKKKMGRDDVILMRFAFDWLKFSLLGQKTIQIKSTAVSSKSVFPRP